MPTLKRKVARPVQRRARETTAAATAGKLTIQRILCPVDFSDSSRLAVERAVALALPYKADITALFVIPLVQAPVGDLVYFPPQVLDAGVRSVVAKDLEEFVRPAGASGVRFLLSLQTGDPVQEILNQASQADVVVMGTHGRSGFERWVLGSVTDKVVRKAPCPIMTVSPRVEPSPEPSRAFETILCAVDLSEASTSTLEYAFSIARMARARLTLLHVVEGLSEANAPVPYGVSQWGLHLEAQARDRLLQKAAGATARDGCEVEAMVVTGKPYREILRVANESRTGLIVVGNHGASPMNRMFLGSTADHVVREASCPVLTVRSRAS